MIVIICHGGRGRKERNVKQAKQQTAMKPCVRNKNNEVQCTYFALCYSKISATASRNVEI